MCEISNKRSCASWLIVCLGFFVGACAPNLGVGNLRVGPLDAAQVSPEIAGLPVFVESVQDARRLLAVAEVDNRLLQANSDVAATVRFALEESLRRGGCQLTMVQSALIRGEILEWFMTVTPQFPVTKANALARLALAVFDSKGQPIFEGVYEGQQAMRHLAPDKQHVEETLQSSMSAAVRAAVNDPDFIEALNRAVLIN